MYNARMARSLLLCVGLAVAAAGCVRPREVEKDLALLDVRTGWWDAGIVEGGQNKLVPMVSLKVQNVSPEDIASVQLLSIFRRVGEQEAWGDHLVRAIDSEGLAPGSSGDTLVLRSPRGYTGVQPRLQMLQNKEFVDAKVEIFGRHGSRTWVKMGEYQIARQLITE
jgi:hypothetical protein